jgi:hypothetical protein
LDDQALDSKPDMRGNSIETILEVLSSAVKNFKKRAKKRFALFNLLGSSILSYV